MPDLVRLGVAGLGWLGEALIEEVAGLAGFEVVGVQDVRFERAQAVGDAYGVAWRGARFEDLVTKPDVDAVLICTPNVFHAKQAQAAMLAGKDVLVQKPLAVSLADAEATIALAHSLNRLLFVDYSYRFLETVLVLQQAVSELGAVQSAQAVFHNIYGPGAEKSWPFDPRLSGGGALIDLGVHLLDLGLWLLQPAEARLEQVRLAVSSDARVEERAQLQLGLDHVPLDLEVSWNAPRGSTEISFEVQGERGLVRWENVDGSFFRFRTLRDNEVLIDRETTLRQDTLRAFADALASRRAPAIDARVYALLDQAYQRAGHPR